MGGVVKSLSSQEVSPASPSVQLEKDEAQQMTVISGQKCLESFKTSNQIGSLLKTCVGLLVGQMDWYSSKCVLTWKVKVTKSNRLLFQLVPSTPRTAGIESGLLPTLNTMESLEPKTLARIVEHNQKARPGRSYLSQNMRELVVYGKRKLDGSPIGKPLGKELRLQPAMSAWMMGYPESWTEFPTQNQDGGKTA